VKKYKVTYEMRYVDDIYGSSDVAVALCPNSTRNLRRMIESVEEVMA
jgi:hypothetical protein